MKEPEMLIDELETTMYTVAEAAKYLQITYQRVVYAIAKRWMIPSQDEPFILIPQSELERYREERLAE